MLTRFGGQINIKDAVGILERMWERKQKCFS